MPTPSLSPRPSSPPELRAVVRADACRRSALRVVNEGATWDGARLGRWLAEEYAPLLGDGATVTPADPEDDRACLGEARAEVVRKVAYGRAHVVPVWVMEAIVRGHVVHAEGSHAAWRPTPAPRRLAERVLSLLAVDYLARREPWGTLIVCRSCDRIDFADEASCSCTEKRRSTIVLHSLPASIPPV